VNIHESSGQMSNASKGIEREEFVNLFLSEVFPNPYRFGTGDITDQDENRSGQLDVVVEFPFLPSLPVVGGSQSRLYMAESVAAVIEVKSDVQNQWEGVERTAEKLKELEPKYKTVLKRFIGPGADGEIERIEDHQIEIPYFAVGYTGWQTTDPLKRRLSSMGGIDGILVIDSGAFACNSRFGNFEGTGPKGLWGLISSLFMSVNAYMSMGANPVNYAMDY